MKKIKFRSPKDYKKIKGLTFIAAKDLLANENKSVRIVRKDKKECALVKDYVPTRLNVELKKGKVVKLISFG